MDQHSDSTGGSKPRRWITVAEAARELVYSVDWVRTLCQRGDLRAGKAGRQWRIDPASVQAYVNAQQPCVSPETRELVLAALNRQQLRHQARSKGGTQAS